MRFRSTVILAALAAVVACALAVPMATAQMTGREKSFVDGLQKHGLLSLVEQYLADLEAQGADPLAIKEQQASLFEMQGQRAGTESQRADLFAKARAKYSELADALAKRAEEATDPRQRDNLRLRALEVKVRLAELIWMREAFDQLNIIELTDKQLGDRKKVEDLMRRATAIFDQIITESDAWLQEMQADPDMERRYLNTGIYEKVDLYKAYSRYRTAWTKYYLAYVLQDGTFGIELMAPGANASAVVKVLVDATGMDENAASQAVSQTPKLVARGLDQKKAEDLKKKLTDAGAQANLEPQKDILLDEAIKTLAEFTEMGDSAEKWQAFRLVGMCYREQGLYDKAIENFRQALTGSKDEAFKIQVYYEMVQTAITTGKFVEARQLMEELRRQNYAAMQTSFIGRYLMPFLDAKIALAEGKTDPEKRQRGLDMMRDLWAKQPTLHVIIAAEVLKHINRADVASLRPFELWILADETYQDRKYAEAEKYFAEYLDKTQPDNPTHVEAMYNLGACYYRLAKAEDVPADKELELKEKAAKWFFEVASRFPDFHSVGQAVESAVLLRSEIYADNPTDDNLKAYADILKWVLNNRPQAAEAANIRWLYANILRTQEKWLDAARQYEQITTDSPNYYDARYFAALSYYQDLVLDKWMTLQADQVAKAADQTVSRMVDYAQWAAGTAAQHQGQVAQDLRDHGAEILMRATEVLAQPRVAQFERGLRLVEEFRKLFAKQDSYRGAILKAELDCYFGQGRTKEAIGVLERLMATNEDVGPVFEQLLSSIIDDIDRLVRQGRRAEVRQRVLPQADQIGKLFMMYLDKKGRLKDVPTLERQLAELHMRAEDLTGEHGAIARYKALAGFDPYAKQEDFIAGKTPAVPLSYLEGLAESTQKAAIAEDANGRTLLSEDPRKAYDLLKQAAWYWEQVADAYEGQFEGLSRKELIQRHFEAEYNKLDVYYLLNPLELKFGGDNKVDYFQLIRDFILTRRASGSDFGTPALKVRFDRLAQRVGT